MARLDEKYGYEPTLDMIDLRPLDERPVQTSLFAIPTLPTAFAAFAGALIGWMR